MAAIGTSSHAADIQNEGVAASLVSSPRFGRGWLCEVSQHISKALKLRLCSAQITKSYFPYPGVEGPAGDIGLYLWRTWIAMRRRETMRNGVAYTSGFGKVVQERLQRGCRGIGRRMAPVYSGVDHFTLKPAPYNEGPAYLSVKIFKCWSKLARTNSALLPLPSTLRWLGQLIGQQVRFRELSQWRRTAGTGRVAAGPLSTPYRSLGSEPPMLEKVVSPSLSMTRAKSLQAIRSAIQNIKAPPEV